MVFDPLTLRSENRHSIIPCIIELELISSKFATTAHQNLQLFRCMRCKCFWIFDQQFESLFVFLWADLFRTTLGIRFDCLDGRLACLGDRRDNYKIQKKKSQGEYPLEQRLWEGVQIYLPLKKHLEDIPLVRMVVSIRESVGCSNRGTYPQQQRIILVPLANYCDGLRSHSPQALDVSISTHKYYSQQNKGIVTF